MIHDTLQLYYSSRYANYLHGYNIKFCSHLHKLKISILEHKTQLLEFVQHVEKRIFDVVDQVLLIMIKRKFSR